MWRTKGLVAKNLRISLVGEGSKKAYQLRL